ncbi:CGNR zinc finger domain-containing protein [Nonomuraea sp. NPDC047897]|uniref:CGNR zinc finger domain-containing protein n=1 Tax=Nonomuraea sp. NPDC047897 TaxID=3364346 RepID=UPI0037140838
MIEKALLDSGWQKGYPSHNDRAGGGAVGRAVAGRGPGGVNRFAAGPPALVRLDDTGRVERAGDLAAALSTVARQAVELLGGPQAVRIKECGAGTCTRRYVDTSRAGARRWCDMQECGNRAKAAKFRARHRAKAAGFRARHRAR